MNSPAGSTAGMPWCAARPTRSRTTLQREPPPGDDIARLLGILAGAGVRIDLGAADPQALLAAARALLDNIEAAKLPESPAPPPTGRDRTSARTVEWLSTLTQSMQALIGDGLPLLPVLRLKGTQLAESFAPGKRPIDAGADQVADWVRILGRVRPGVASANDALWASELVAGASAPGFTVTQTPAAADQRWIAAPRARRVPAAFSLRTRRSNSTGDRADLRFVV